MGVVVKACTDDDDDDGNGGAAGAKPIWRSFLRAPRVSRKAASHRKVSTASRALKKSWPGNCQRMTKVIHRKDELE